MRSFLRPPARPRRGVAIPLVAGFCFLAVVFGIMMAVIRVEDKRQNLMGFQQLKAYFLAQAAIQHALLKVGSCPTRSTTRAPSPAESVRSRPSPTTARPGPGPTAS